MKATFTLDKDNHFQSNTQKFIMQSKPIVDPRISELEIENEKLKTEIQRLKSENA
ncbi:MAG: hypothetical protein FWG65_10870 [Turicibacter sp.]|nr:hypothetical protein [Turicibacter sp.]